MAYVGVKPAAITSATQAEIAGDLTVDTNTLKVDAANNRVGVGSTSPSTLLHASGSSVVTKFESSNNQFVTEFNYNNSTSRAFIGTFDNNLVFAPSNATVGMRLTSDGLCFGSDTAAANALNDYEEGDWEPTLLGASSNPTVSYSGDNGGHYVKIGTLLYLTGCLRYSAVSGGSGTARVGGLPFTIDARSNGDNSDGCGSVRTVVWNGTAGAKPQIFGAVPSADKLTIYSTDEDHTATTLQISDMGTTCMMQFSIVVHTAS